ncbi:hypothetical protein DSL72_001871 [Monilinia vaccinii-corymbosi]|uniref:Glycosyl transferase family 25 domain-containing protein n=1 Tax=Monilinia vaccinii-corymbosi TaxID=61207 RepID=A0A8A3PB22_9HELO|nr:hypothetical protein DSL72_001871 [Monilinia vaccinii-corymbosi]
MFANMRYSQARWPLAVGGLLFIWIVLYVQHRRYIPSPPTRFSYMEGLKAKPTLSAVRNKTMGFGAVLMAIMPDRTDQMDTASLLSYYSDIDITIIPGVSNVPEKTRPPGGAQLKPGQIGCWRVHMNMMRYVVDHRLETALILEGDADWDVRIKDQLEELSKHMPGSSNLTPYGLDWDIFYTGAFIHYPDGDNLGPGIRYHDKTVGTIKGSGYEKMEFKWVAEDLQAYKAEDHQRVIHRAHTPYATAGYMVTLEGARRILYQLGLHQQTAPVDIDLLEALHRRDLNGLIVVPPLMAQYKTDDAAKNSDIEAPKKPAVEGSGPCIAQSIRASLRAYSFDNTSRVDWIDRTDLTR